MAAKIISGIVVIISLIAVAFASVPSFWFWASLELLAALLVAYGCIGEWYLHHHPSGRAKREKDAHHKQESRYIFSVALGVAMEFFIVAHSIQEGVRMERTVAFTNERAEKAVREAAKLNDRAASNELQVASLIKSNLTLRGEVVSIETKVALSSQPVSTMSAQVTFKLNLNIGDGDDDIAARRECYAIRSSLTKARFTLKFPSGPTKHADFQHGYGMEFAADEVLLSSPYPSTNPSASVLFHPVSIESNWRIPQYPRNPFNLNPYWRDSTNLLSGMWVHDIESAEFIDLRMFQNTKATIESGEVLLFVNGYPWKHAVIRKGLGAMPIIPLTQLEAN